jgi:sigma-B regulation protein RsbU (phosphoserine phosphatase)
MLKFHSLRTKILLIVLFFILFSGIAFFVNLLYTTSNYKRLRLDEIEKTVEFETEKVNKIIAEIERAAVFYALGGMLCYEAQSEELGEKLAIEYITSLPLAVGGGFWFEPYAFKEDKLRAGFYAFYDKTTGRVRFDDTFLLDEYDYHNKVWYMEISGNITQSYQVVWTRPYVDDSGSFSLMTTAGAGTFDKEGRLVAISTVDWEIDEVIKELISIIPTENSSALLCVPEKDFIISSTRTNSFPGASVSTIPWDIYSGSFTLNNVNFLNFKRYMDNGWLLAIQIPENEIFSEVEKQNRLFSILIVTASALMLFLAYLLISRLINAPIKQLTSDVSRLVFGNLDTRINIESKDELGQLAQAFNKMTGDLKKSIEENAHEHAEKERISTELSVATEIQASMLPCIFPPFPEKTEFDIYASMLPAREVGGDFYDFFFIDKENLVVVIADVSGKGIPAALFMVITKTLIKNCSSCRNPKSVFETVNKKLCEGNETSMFVTAFLGFYNVPTGKFIYVNAGHNPPLIKKRGKGYEFLKTEPCLVLAFLNDTKYKEEVIFLEPEDTLYLYTDGVTEAMNNDKDMFGEQRLLAAANQAGDSSTKELLHSIKRELDNFTDGAEQYDDVTMLALKITKPVSDSEKTKELVVEAKLENLEKTIDFINAKLKTLEYPPDLQNEIDIAIEEIFMNIANYAYEPQTGEVAVSISTEDKTLIRFEDSGKPFNPLEQPAPDFEKPITARDIGGLGVFMVKKIMDEIEYTRQDDKNILTVIKYHPTLTLSR